MVRSVTTDGARPGGAVIEELARERLGFGQLRPGQLRAAEALAGGRDVLAVLPTGGGKSAIYELAGLLRAGPTVVVSPLIALQDDQLAHLRAAGLEAVVLNSQQAAGVVTYGTDLDNPDFAAMARGAGLTGGLDKAISIIVTIDYRCYRLTIRTGWEAARLAPEGTRR